MSGGGKEGEGSQTEWVWIIFAVVAALVCWLIWTYARKFVVMPAFAINLAMIWAVELIVGIGQKGMEYKSYVTGVFDGRLNPDRDVTWADFVAVRDMIGTQVRVAISAIIVGLAVLIVFRMKGENFKRVFSLGGGKGRGPSLALEQAKMWKTATAGALFDPDGRDKDILPARTPPEWLHQNGISFDNGLLDRDACEVAFSKQLGKSWHGVARADLQVQVVLILAGMHLTRNKQALASRENISIAWSAGQDGTKAMQELVETNLKNEKLVSVIDKVCSKHAFSATAVISMMELARRKGGVLPSADFIWMRRLDRDLWYTINNVGRRRFHTEGAGSISHYFSERVIGSPLPEPHVDEAMNGIEDYFSEHALESLSEYFKPVEEY